MLELAACPISERLLFRLFRNSGCLCEALELSGRGRTLSEADTLLPCDGEK